MNSFLRERAWKAFGSAMAALRRHANRAHSQIERELKLIEKLKLAGYFLIVWDLVRFCREQNILLQGRIGRQQRRLLFAGITAVDPVGMELLFERFLSEERGEWPDIDLDLPSATSAKKLFSMSTVAMASAARHDGECHHLPQPDGSA